MEYTVRRAALADADTLVGFTVAEAAESEGAAKPAATIRAGIVAALADETVATYWVLDAGSQAIGNISVVKEWSDWHAGYYWWIQSMYLLPSHRGRGLMRLLLQAVEQAARDQAALELRLYVHQDNARAIQAYRKAGFNDSAYRIMTLGLGRGEGHGAGE
ncbi:MAG TPA: GNAT family N-acetyltransferase [Herpetosiphonaceae bacterium]|nr:GNAT family N-acetyltransferase [Herpetosiphonaceae bacterium]